MSSCNENHRDGEIFESLPEDQGGKGRHKCAGCAYEQGFAGGSAGLKTISLDLDSLPESQAGAVRHRSPLAAFALGYYKGVLASYGRR